MKKEKFEYETTSGNIFADLEFNNPEEMLAKAELTSQIYELIKKKKLSKSSAAKLLNIDQQKLSDLITGRLLENLTLQDLFKLLNHIDSCKKEALNKKRYKALEELTKQAQELDMGY